MSVDVFSVYDLFIGVATGVGLVYLLYLEENVVRYQPFLLVVTAGVVVFSVVSPVTELLAPRWSHVVHGVAALIIIVGLYIPVHQLLNDGGTLPMLVRNPAAMRHPPTWMSPMDDNILELFHSAELVLTPAIIAYNLDYSREEVNRHLSELESHGIVERVDRGKYRITAQGEGYLDGQMVSNSRQQKSDEPPTDESLNL